MKEKECISVNTDKVEKFRFLRMNYMSKYNNEMVDVDIAYQLRN